MLLTFLAIEFLDELVYGAREAAWPLIRSDLGLSYIQVGLLLSVPALVSNFVEPVIGVLGDVWRRRGLILGGGALFAASLTLIASSPGFVLLLAAFILLSPASGAFVSLSQASLMDTDPARHEQNMDRWTFAGSFGVVLGAVVLALVASIGFGWRGIFWAFAVATVLILISARRVPIGGVAGTGGQVVLSFRRGIAGALSSLRSRSVIRWLVLLQFSSAMPGRSATVLSLRNVSGLLGSLIPLGIGMAASAWGLGPAMWLLAAGPIALLVGIPRPARSSGGVRSR